MGQVLLAIDTNHIQGYVFNTDRLKEIRGASSLLDKLNRVETVKLAENSGAETVFANGGAALFLVETEEQVDTEEQVELLGQRVEQSYRELTSGGASITYAIQKVPPPSPRETTNVWQRDLQTTLALLRYRLREAKGHSPDVVALPSHPFMRPCDACGVAYAEQLEHEKGEQAGLYCASCLLKRHEDKKVKGRISSMTQEPYEVGSQNAYLWERLINGLKKDDDYVIPEDTERPSDFNIFRNFLRSKDYLGVIYADANNMGKRMEELRQLDEVKRVADGIDDAIYNAVIAAIKQHLPVYVPPQQSKDNPPLFPFDVLLMGGDDIVMVTDAAKAIDVALTLANTFFDETQKIDTLSRGGTLSVGVVLVPVKYPFGLSLALVESALKFAKKEGAKRQRKAGRPGDAMTLINFMTILGNTGRDFNAFYEILKSDKKHNAAGKNMYATLRPYEPEQLQKLITAIRKGHEKRLGRTKLHQLREAIVRKNMTTTISDVRAISRTWKEEQRNFVYDLLYDFAMPYQSLLGDIQGSASLLYHIPFPWFADGEDTYRTVLLDFVELYDFVTEGDSEDAN